MLRDFDEGVVGAEGLTGAVVWGNSVAARATSKMFSMRASNSFII